MSLLSQKNDSLFANGSKHTKRPSKLHLQWQATRQSLADDVSLIDGIFSIEGPHTTHRRQADRDVEANTVQLSLRPKQAIIDGTEAGRAGIKRKANRNRRNLAYTRFEV